MRAARTRCEPAGTSLMGYRPSTPVRAPIVVPTMVIATLGIGAPAVRSVIVPLTRPLAVCAEADAATKASDETQARLQRARVQFIRHLLSKTGRWPILF